MRTSSATAGNTGTEYKLMNMTQGPQGNSFNFTNQNQTFIIGGYKSTMHAGTSKLSVLSGQNSNSNSMMGYSSKVVSQQKKPSSVKAKKINKKTMGINIGLHNAVPN